MSRRFALLLGLAVVLGVTAPLPGDDPKPKPRGKDEALKLFADEFVPLTPGKDKFPASFTMGSRDGPDAEKPAHTSRPEHRDVEPIGRHRQPMIWATAHLRQ